MRPRVPVLSYSEGRLQPRFSKVAIGSGILGVASLFSFPLAIVVPYDPKLWRAAAALAVPTISVFFGGASWIRLEASPLVRGRWLCMLGIALGVAAAVMNYVLLPSLNRCRC